MNRDVLAVVMAGGMGSRLRPLTNVRAKPAVPFGAIYRIIDFTLSNCINSGIRQIYVLTQYKSHSLTNHLMKGWNFLSPRLNQFIEEIPAQMQRGNDWYKGTADAIRQNMGLFAQCRPRLVLVLSGDHVYKMDYRQMAAFHAEKKAQVTVAVVRVPAELARGNYGVIEVNAQGQVVGFQEKPENPITLPGTNDCLASMGIYLFDYDSLVTNLNNEMEDFGKHILPGMVANGEPVYAFDYTESNRIVEYEYEVFGGHRHMKQVNRSSDSAYWRDVGTLDAYWKANLDLVTVTPAFNLHGQLWPMFCCPNHFPPSKFVHEDAGRTGVAVSSIITDGVIISGATVRHSVLGAGLYVHSYALIENTVMMGGTITGVELKETSVGRGCRIRNAIIDKNVYLPEGVCIGYDRAADERAGLTTVDLPDSDHYLVAVPKDYCYGGKPPVPDTPIA